jgi:hypothetical protein
MKDIDSKYATDGTYLYNKVSGEVLPEDEPLFLLRARDILAVDAIQHYLNLCNANKCVESHLLGVIEVLRRFENFQVEHPDRMKQPGITGHVKLGG